MAVQGCGGSIGPAVGGALCKAGRDHRANQWSNDVVRRTPRPADGGVSVAVPRALKVRRKVADVSPVPARVEAARLRANELLDPARRSEMGQFMTPWPIADFMASMFKPTTADVRLLDAGAGVGSLTAGFIATACKWKRRPKSIAATCYEVDPVMLTHLRATMQECAEACAAAGIPFTGSIVERDFIEAGAELLDTGLFGAKGKARFTTAILNPPYRKINSDSRERELLRWAGIEASNLYAAFVGLAVKLLEPGGEMVAITPRSFCNGPYFRPFRQLLLGETSLQQVHVFESRDRAFRDDAVLQENVIFHVRKGSPRGEVTLTTSAAPGAPVSQRVVQHDLVVQPNDPDAFVHLAVSEADGAIAGRVRGLPCTLQDLGVQVSTGRVVDFRARQFIRRDPEPGTVPLIYPAHFEGGFVAWPKIGGRKPNAISAEEGTRALMVPSEVYVLTKRFTSKEERRRVVAAVYDPSKLPKDVQQVGIENHVNYYHANGSGLPKTLAKGLAAFLNSTLVDQFFRQFNGHTQVNASDLRSLRYPTREAMVRMGGKIRDVFPEQDAIDAIVAEALAE
ncbi:MAG: Eco57I restriction-modification methylase domain-containing protein [Planctomycetes bacterium]|nr:Eco57I restriction-modification methylase domain-containing protein [Planctomycetota bacterium]MCC7395631.1 Eco57I restriction-modification methylase domain-containing protein [Planctomycetota bacterium]